MPPDPQKPLSTDPFATDEQQNASPPTPMQAFWQTHPNARYLAKGTLDILPAAGAIVGGVASTPETFGTGTVAGAALGAGVGRGARDLLAEQLGIDSPTTPLSKASRIALDTAITAAVPTAVSTARRFLMDPKTTFADLIETVFHPQGSADKVVNYLRASAAPVTNAAAPWAVPNAAEPMKMLDGTWGYRSIATGEPLAEGTTANVLTKAGKTFTTTVPGMADPEADVRAAKLLIGSGQSAVQAATKASGGNSARFMQIMKSLGKGQ